ncbi:MAG: hypothetical protein ACM3ME_04220 [Chloroflexota bacterium]|nr:hypothetical protein [Lentimicrobium sp.]
MTKIRILGIKVNNKAQSAHKVQNVLTRYGCSIKTRLGLNDPDDNDYGNEGLILLELTGESSEWTKLENDLLSLEGVEVSKMDFNKSRVIV